MINKLKSILDSSITLEKQTFINAFVSTLTDDEAISLIETSIDEPFKLRRSIVRRVKNDIEENFQDKHLIIVKRLFQLLDQSKGNSREKIAYCIKELLTAFPYEAPINYLKILLDSKYVTIRRRAYNIIKNKWFDEYIELIKGVFYKNCDIEAARIFINKLPLSYLESSFDFLDKVTQYDFIRRKLYLRLIEQSPSIIERLKDEDPVTYVYMRCKAEKPLTHDEALELFFKAQPTDKSGIMIWAIGKMGLSQTLEELLLQWPKIEEDISNIPIGM